MAVGQVLGGRYRVGELLGSGGMASVWLGRDLLLDRPVAVKKLTGAGLTEPTAVERFEREARTVARLAHPNIVAVHDFGSQDGEPYLVMELVEGETVGALLDRGPLTVEQAVAIAAQTCDGLSAAHSAGIIHRDVKPANLIVTPAGLVKICDFGIARMVHAASQASLTASAVAMGSANYMAPEQANDRPMDARVDLYALGCTLYAMLTGAPPFTGDTAVTILHHHLTRSPTPLARHRRDVPVGLEALVGELLAKAPEARPATADQVKARLLAALPDRPFAAVRPPEPLASAVPEAAALIGVRSADATADIATGADPTQDLPAGRPDRRAQGGSRGRVVAAAVVVGLVAIALLASALLEAERRELPSATPADPTATTAATTSLPSASPRPGAVAPPTRPANASPSTRPPTSAAAPRTSPAPVEPVAAMRVSIQRQVDTGNLNPDAAGDLFKKVDEIAKELRERDTEEATKKVGELRDKLLDLLDGGKLTAAGYAVLTRQLDNIAAEIP
jgi:eukaryotic-like serine/threonine-protein kinase